MPAYVDQYLRLEQRARDAEDKVADYTARAESDHWEQCRIVYEAVESEQYDRASFAREVNMSRTHIARQFSVWEAYGDRAPSRRPTYADAYEEAGSDRPAGHRDVRGARRALSDPQTARQVLSDPQIARSLMKDDHTRVALTRARDQVDTERTARSERRFRESAPGLAEATEYYDAMARIQHARQDVNRALDRLRGLPPLDADSRLALKQETEWLDASVQWLYELLKARRPASLADEVQEYLAAEGAT